MLAKITSGATVGLNATLIDVEVDIQDGLPALPLKTPVPIFRRQELP
ncbi:MAG: hypothetical protein US95_C0003G0021 [Candidatus Woesebacteria bacterium GW2011_GWB1_38_5]|uniref:Uncharacterized protein n=1 Tax=Candidatus Woesebacteria bacterium GW2011_GWB1_38_5 TaxID=1618568 RepID=A0A0G0MP65_9BACT|nr:MAG: hypothetical protein US95_C0003G0021 [Candidatus Woesebacteria bacterium GW2011_GWB1_38_5]